MSKNSYAETINSAKLMISGLQATAERVQKRGLDADFIARFEEVHQQAQQLDNEQERMKAELKSKTAELNSSLEELKAMLSESQKIVKIEMEKESWQTFGITAKR